MKYQIFENSLLNKYAEIYADTIDECIDKITTLVQDNFNTTAHDLIILKKLRNREYTVSSYSDDNCEMLVVEM